jgi:type II secretory pathway component PulC
MTITNLLNIWRKKNEILISLIITANEKQFIIIIKNDFKKKRLSINKCLNKIQKLQKKITHTKT